MARFEWAQVVAFDDEAKPAITPDDILDARPDKLRLGLQPYLSLLELNYEVDEFLLAVKKSEAAVLRTKRATPSKRCRTRSGRKKRVRLPKRKRIHLAVHRTTTCFITSVSIRRFCHSQALREGRDRGGSLLARHSRPRSEPASTGPTEIKEWFQRLVVARLVLPVSKK